MANVATDQIMRPYGQPGRFVELPVAASTTIYKGTLVSQLAADAGLVACTTALSGRAIGVATHGADNSSGSLGAKRCIVDTDGVHIFANDVTNPVDETLAFGAELYATDDHTVSDTNTGSDPIAGYFAGLEPDGRVRVKFSVADVGSPVISDFTTAQHDHEDAAGGGQITPADAFDAAVPILLGGSGVTAVGTAKQVLRTNAGATGTEWGNALDPDLKGTIEIPLGTIADADGDFTKFADGSTDGLTISDSKAVCYRINNAGPPPKSLCGFGVPADADVSADFTLKFLVSKSGATVGDATTIAVEAFAQVDGALHDADTDFGGTTNALTGDATAKTCDVLSLALASADLPAVGSNVSLTFQPTNGTLGTDDLLIHRVWVEYTKAVDA